VDNLDEIGELFDCVYGSKYAGEYAYFCKTCGKECNVSETQFECQDGRVIPTFIVCRYGCGKKWQLKICLQESLNSLPH
jgi:hypothetical protein